MKKAEFVTELAKKLAGIPKDDLVRSLDYYNEMIDDRIDDGMTEEDAVAAMGSIDDIATQILSETSLFKLLRERIRPRRTLKAWEIVLLIIGALVCLPIVMGVLATLLSVYVVLWSVVAALFATDIGLVAGALGGLVGGVVLLIGGGVGSGVVLFGLAILSLGLAIFLFFGSLWVTKWMVWISKKILLAIKALFVRKEEDA